MEEASNGKVEETTLKEVAETGDERKEGLFEEDGEYNYKVEVHPVRGVSVVDGNSGEATETQCEKEAKDDEEGDDEKVRKEEKILPLAEEEGSVSVAQSGAVSVEHTVAEEAATQDSEKVDAAAVEGEEETEVEIPSAETANGVVLTAGDEEMAPVAVDESDVVVPVVEGAAAAVEERATEGPVLAEEEEEEGDSTPAAADVATKESGEDPSLAQPPTDAPPISEGGIGAEHGVDKGDIPESPGSPVSVPLSEM